MMLRSERKYLVGCEKLGELRRRLMPFVSPDPMAPSQSDVSQYTVRSIYFDTPAFDALNDKVEGYEYKRKLRVRGYDEFMAGSDVFLEIKERMGAKIRKRRARTLYERLSHTLEHGELQPGKVAVPAAEGSAAMSFFYLFKRYRQRPANLVVYEREPFVGRFDLGLRITLDKSVRAALFPRLSDLYVDVALAPVWKGSFVLEIKYLSERMPSWLRSTIQQFGLRWESLSKYASAFEGGDEATRNFRI